MHGPFEYPFRVRFQECDAYGVVDSTGFLYYMQETFMAHAAQFGYTFESELEKRRVWMIRETDIQYLRPVRYGETVDVTMRMGDHRKASLVRTYEMKLRESGESVARAWSEFVVLNADSLRLMPIPKDVIEEFFADSVPGKLVPRDRFPESPPAPPKVFRVMKRVEWRDMDMQRHVNNCTYLDYLLTAGNENLAQVGWPISRFLDLNIAPATQWNRVRYQGQATIGDELEVTSYVSSVGASSLLRHEQISRVEDGAVLTLAVGRWVWLDLASLKPRRIPEGFLEDSQDYIVDNDAG